MITDKTQAELAKMGARHRTSYLVQQARYTLGLALGEGPALTALLPAGLLDETAALCDTVDKARQDKAVMAAEAKQATGAQNDSVRELKVWLRKAVNRAVRASHPGAPLPDELTAMGNLQSVPALLEKSSKVLGLLAEHAATLAKVGPDIQSLIDDGKKRFQALEQADILQEQARVSDLSDAVFAFYVAKANLYIALKIINSAGHELHAGDPRASSRYNLSILHRHGAASGEPEPEPEPVPPVTKPS
jgi:hypothetical protein